jgi:hypothetical protein
MIRYLFDASAAVEIYRPRSPQVGKVIQALIDQRTVLRRAAFFIPSFCIAEVFNTFAKWHFDPADSRQKIDWSVYEQLVRKFRQDIRWGRMLYTYDLNRYHIMAADEIIPIEHTVARRDERDHLSTYDILLIAMACELHYIGPAESVHLVTCDRRIQIVCEEFRRSDIARVRRKVSRALDEPEASRWFPPRVLYLPALKLSDIPSPELSPRG